MTLIKKFNLIFITFFIVTAAAAQDQKVQNYINTYKELAKIEMARTGVPAAIKLAQGILESASGQSKLAQQSNNHFGIKCKTEWTGGKTYHDDDFKGECFRVYNSAEESFIDHSDFLKNRHYYKELFTLDISDYKAWAYGLKKAGYATNKKYPEMLISLIERYDLAKYNAETLANIDMYRYLATNRGATKTDYEQSLAKSTEQAIQVLEAVKTEPIIVATAPVVIEQKSNYPQGIFTINGVKVLYAEQGFSLERFCKARGLPYNKLLAYNDMQPAQPLTEGRLIYLEKRKKKGNKAIFNTKKGNTLREIALLEGIRLDQLKKYNNINADAKIAANQTIYLQKKSPNKIIVLN